MYALLLLISIIVTPSITTKVLPAGYVLHERQTSNIVNDWIKGNRIPGHVQLPARIGLSPNPSALTKAEDWLMDVSYPTSKNYGRHWSQDEVIEAFKPTGESVEAVHQWLATERVLPRDHITQSANKAWLAFDASAKSIEKLLHAEFYEYKHKATGESMIACEQYYIPASLVDHIDYIKPGVKGIRLQRQPLDDSTPRNSNTRRSTALLNTRSDLNATLENCDKLVTPACIQALYGFRPQDSDYPISSNNSLGVYEQYTPYNQSGLDEFNKQYAPYILQGTAPIFRSIDGGITPAENKNLTTGNIKDFDNLEADFDLQVAMPIVYPQNITNFQTGDPYVYDYSGIYNTFFDAIDGSYCTYPAYGETGDAKGIDPTYPDPSNQTDSYKGKLQCGVFKPTNVIALTYTSLEFTLPYYYQKRQCLEILKLGLQGVSIFISSGDDGVGCAKNGTFSPTAPVTCPYITSVGATMIQPNSTVFDPEVAANKTFYPGGGFSNIFDVPSYQKRAVANYFDKHDPSIPYYYNGNFNTSAGFYNRNGRGFPDVSAIGDNIALYAYGKRMKGAGTTPSAPIFASLINRIVDERLKVGKGPLGFVNPVLYEHPKVLNDITHGSNPSYEKKCSQGFDAEEGWDPVTGLGTPNYPKMLDLFLSLP